MQNNMYNYVTFCFKIKYQEVTRNNEIRLIYGLTPSLYQDPVTYVGNCSVRLYVALA